MIWLKRGTETLKTGNLKTPGPVKRGTLKPEHLKPGFLKTVTPIIGTSKKHLQGFIHSLKTSKKGI